MVQKIHLISFGNREFNKSLDRLEKEATKFGVFDSIKIYRPDNISVEFANKYSNILSEDFGAGYWIWKFNIIQQRLNDINNNDILIYLDAGCSINYNGKDRFYEYIELLNNSDKGIISFKLPDTCKEYIWTIEEIFKELNINSEDKIYNSSQYLGGILIMKKCDNLQLILDKSLELIDKDTLMITNHYVKRNKDKHSFFRDNRHDQSILSVIRKLYGSAVILDDETIYLENDHIIWDNDIIMKYPFWATRIKN